MSTNVHLYPGLIVLVCMISAGCTGLQQKASQDAMTQIKTETGLSEITIPGSKLAYLGKTHRGYPVVYHAEMGELYGRYAARLAMGELGHEAGGILAFLTGSQEYGMGVAGSALDRLLADAIGQPLSISIVMTHGKKTIPRLDVLSSYAKFVPADMLHDYQKVGFNSGSVYTDDPTYGARVVSNAHLMETLKKMRCQYIRVDQQTAAFLWAGQENDYSAMIREFGGFSQMLNAIMDALADLVDAAPSAP